jgi:hypothetical protein
VLNLAVAAIATVRFARAGHFSWPLLWPFALTSVPFAFVGGAIQLPRSGTSRPSASCSSWPRHASSSRHGGRTTPRIMAAPRSPGR